MYKAKTKDYIQTAYTKYEEKIDLDFLTPKKMQEEDKERIFNSSNNVAETLQRNIETYNNFAEKQNKLLSVEHVNKEISDLFNTLDKQKITDIKEGDKIYVCAVKETNTRYGPNFYTWTT